jgi:hypothetical protein
MMSKSGFLLVILLLSSAAVSISILYGLWWLAGAL